MFIPAHDLQICIFNQSLPDLLKRLFSRDPSL